MIGEVDHGRRRFLGTAAMTIAARASTCPAGLRAKPRRSRHGGSGSDVCHVNWRRSAAAARVAQFATPDTIEPCAARWCSSTSGPTPASTGCARCHMFAPGRRSTGTGARRDRRAHTRVRIRKEPRQRASRRAADADRVPGRDRQRLRDLARLQEPILAGPLLH